MTLIEDILVNGHKAVIHFPIIGIIMGFAAGMTALFLGISRDYLKRTNRINDSNYLLFNRYMERFEFLSFALVIMGVFGLIIAAVTGLQASGSIDTALSQPLLEFKMRLSILLFFIMLTPIVQKTYFGVVHKAHIFTVGSKVLPLLYLLPLLVSAFLTLLISSAGGQYSYGFNFLDSIGLGNLLPTE